jgi:tetratricopeptide (TPR) repeat protein
MNHSLLLSSLALLSVAACAHPEGSTQTRTPKSSTPAPAVGSVNFPVSCDADVQDDFSHAVALLHHMTYPQAREEFQAIAKQDPHCAMAQWGIAMTLFQPLWPTRPSAADLANGFEVTQKALQLAPTDARERGFIEAVAAFFHEPAGTDYWKRIDAWKARAEALQAALPQDPEVNAFYALALLASARPGPSVQEHSAAAVKLLLPIYQDNPNHPGAMHYIIHANDVPGREHENVEVLQRYEQLAPDNPHALHMPTHIYTRLGNWDGVVRGNLRAANAALKYPAGEHGELVWDEFAHAIEYLVYAYLQQGADERAAEQIARLFATSNIEPSAKTAFHLASTRARYTLERSAFSEAAALVPREPALVDWDRSPWPEAISWFAHGYGALRTGDRVEPVRAVARLGELEQHASAAGEAVFASQIRMLRWELEGWSAHVAGDDARALALLQQAVELEGATPKPAVTPAATLPAPELLGELLLELGRPSEALAAYKRSLERFPHRFNGMLGVVRALAAAGDEARAAQAYCELRGVASQGTRLAAFDDLAKFRAKSDVCEH